MNTERNYPDTDGASLALRDSCVSSLAFGPIKGPGASARKHTRSCRCVLARRHGGGASVLAHTNVPVRVRTGRHHVSGLRSLALVSGHSRPTVLANPIELCALNGFLCGYRETQDPAFIGIGIALPIVGPVVYRRSVLSSMTPDSRSSRAHRGGINHVSAFA
jgi:hypothetical protein